jgi:gliding-associated putative ABC transporter substrate-binding component GldG
MMFDRIIRARYGWLAVLSLLVGMNLLFSLFNVRLDLTEEKRFTLSDATRRLVRELDGPVEITVLLDGDMPAGFQKLANASRDLLSDMRDISPDNITFTFARPAADADDSTRVNIYDSLQRMGINPTNVKAQTKKGEGTEETLLFAGAVIRFGDRTVGVDLLSGQSQLSGIESLNNAEALLEYRFADAIRRATRQTVPLVGYLAGNGEPLDFRIYDLIEQTLRPNYAFRIIPIDSVTHIPSDFSALCVVKPMQPFTDAQKLKIDQYVMRGGRVVWMLDNLYASLDSLQRSEGSFIAFDLGLNLEDLLFRYGVRINRDLVQDLQNDGIPSVIGQMGDKPQIEVLPWPYYPLLRHTGGHPIAKNMDYVLAKFPQSIDTVKASGIRKTILLSTSPAARSLPTPARVEWESIRTQEDLASFSASAIPVAVLLEGRFSSLYANRIGRAQADTIEALQGTPFLSSAVTEGKMVVVADGDLPLNDVSQQDGPLQMGMNAYTRQQYANRNFLLNTLEYLTDSTGILETRSKDYTLRLLDDKQVEAERLRWQLLDIAGPMLLMLISIAGWQYWRKRRYGASQ